MQQHLDSFSAQLRETVVLLGKQFFHLLFALGLPLLVSSFAVWVVSGVFIDEFNSLTSLAQFPELFTAGSFLTYLLLISVLIIAIANVLSFIATPLVIVKPELTYKRIFPEAFKFFGSMLWLLICLSVLALLGIIVAAIILAVVLIFAGLINEGWIDPVYTPVSDWSDRIILALVVLFTTFAPFYVLKYNDTGVTAIKRSVRVVWHNLGGVTVRLIIVSALVAAIGYPLAFVPVVGTFLSTIVSAMLYTVYVGVMFKQLDS